MSTTTDISHFTPDKISIRGQDLGSEILGKRDFVDVVHFCVVGKYPTEREKNMLNALLILAIEHGITPSILAARMTYVGAPEAMQAAVAAGLLGAGTVLLGASEHAARLYKKHAAGLSDGSDEDALKHAASALCRDRVSNKLQIFGFGHPIHKEGDPRVPALRQISKDNGYYGVHWLLADKISEAFRSLTGKDLPMNAAGAAGAMIADMGLDLIYGNGLVLIARSAGVIGHLVEERKKPIGSDIWKMVATTDSRNSFPG